MLRYWTPMERQLFSSRILKTRVAVSLLPGKPAVSAFSQLIPLCHEEEISRVMCHLLLFCAEK